VSRGKLRPTRLRHQQKDNDAAQFERKNAGNLFAGRGGKPTGVGKQVKSTGDFELITWLVIKDKKNA
jgi:hypothetical protein